MPTSNRRRLVPVALQSFLRQDYPNLELVILDDGADPVGDLIPPDRRIRYERLHTPVSIGRKRNLACDLASGEVIVHWDDDDWSAPWRVSYQLSALAASGTDLCGLDRVLFYEPATDRVWEYRYPERARRWVYGATLCYRRSFWREHPFPDVRVGEDTSFVWSTDPARIHILEDQTFYVGTIHDANTSRKNTADARWHQRPGAAIPPETRDAFARRNGSPRAGPPRPLALVSVARGVGDIVRLTPLVRAASWLGFDVDVLLAPDYADAASLLRNAPEIRRLFLLPSPWSHGGATEIDGLEATEYDVAMFTEWTAAFRGRVRARRKLGFDRDRWLKEGDAASADRLARELGWKGPMPPPFAMASTRRFGLPAGTVALHPGCKPDWPWKRWHGFDALAAQLRSVAILGTPGDLDNRGTYFSRPFSFPPHALSFVGTLDLPDTAALLQECAALVSNDSGLMHLGVAVGIPVFGVFGITSPAREALSAPNMFPISKGLSCEAECRRGAWGRRDCARHLECLRTLSADDVLARMEAEIPGVLFAAGDVRRGELRHVE
jgi:ADP-heptose:LPS heptosyltransferase